MGSFANVFDEKKQPVPFYFLFLPYKVVYR